MKIILTGDQNSIDKALQILDYSKTEPVALILPSFSKLMETPINYFDLNILAYSFSNIKEALSLDYDGIYVTSHVQEATDALLNAGAKKEEILDVSPFVDSSEIASKIKGNFKKMKEISEKAKVFLAGEPTLGVFTNSPEAINVALKGETLKDAVKWLSIMPKKANSTRFAVIALTPWGLVKGKGDALSNLATSLIEKENNDKILSALSLDACFSDTPGDRASFARAFKNNMNLHDLIGVKQYIKRNISENPIETLSENLKELEKFAQKAKELGLTTVVAELPLPSEFKNALGKKIVDKAKSELLNTVKKIKAAFISESRLKMSPEDFADFEILNEKGVNKFSAYLRDFLAKKASGKIRIGFYMRNHTAWDKQRPLFDALMKDPRFEVTGLVLPKYEYFDVGKHPYYYKGEERAYFHSLYKNIIDVVDEKGNVLDIGSLDFDYVFATRPYDDMLPHALKTETVSKYAKVCYISYSTNWDDEEWLNRFKKSIAFYNYLYFYFAETEAAQKTISEYFKRSILQGRKKSVFLGFPAIEELFKKEWHEPKMQLTWTPTHDRIVPGGSSFFVEYAQNFLSLKDAFPELTLVYRPHPVMYEELKVAGLLKQETVDDFHKRLDELKIHYDTSAQVVDTLEDTKILLTGRTGLIIRYFLKNRPIIYTPENVDNKLLVEGHSLLPGLYLAHNWEEVTKHIKHILKNGDTLKDKRNKIIESIKSRHMGAVSRIIEALAEDFKS